MRTGTVSMQTFQQAAYKLAETNHYFETSIIRTYWFRDPQEKEIRLVHIDTDTVAKSAKVRPFYFGASTEDGILIPSSAIALIHPNDEKHATLPEGWGEWNTPTDIWEWNN